MVHNLNHYAPFLIFTLTLTLTQCIHFVNILYAIDFMQLVNSLYSLDYLSLLIQLANNQACIHLITSLSCMQFASNHVFTFANINNDIARNIIIQVLA